MSQNRVVTIANADLARSFIPEVNSIGTRYVRTSRAVKAIQVTSEVNYTLADGTRWNIPEGWWVCRMVSEDTYFCLPNDLFMALFELPTP